MLPGYSSSFFSLRGKSQVIRHFAVFVSYHLNFRTTRTSPILTKLGNSVLPLEPTGTP